MTSESPPSVQRDRRRWRPSRGTAGRALSLSVSALLVIGTAASAQPAASVSVIPDLVPKADLPFAPESEVNVSIAPEVPPASGRTDPAIVEVHFEIVENITTLDPATGLEYETWGYRINGDDRAVSGTPGPMVRARVGDILRFTITNPETNAMPHNVDFHAVTGQGGGAADTTVVPGQTRTIEARLLYPGLYLYHCAFGDVPEHIARGMYGGILGDPAEPLPPAEHELYIVQSEFYTIEAHPELLEEDQEALTGEVDAQASEPGLVQTDRAAVTAEHPSLVVFNGAVGSLTGENAPRIGVGERLRIYFVNAGLNLISSFHAIGSHWDVVYPEAALLSPPIRGSQTTLVPAGGGTVVELIGQVPSTLLLVDHALARTFDKGTLGQVIVEGEPNPEIFEALPVE